MTNSEKSRIVMEWAGVDPDRGQRYRLVRLYRKDNQPGQVIERYVGHDALGVELWSEESIPRETGAVLISLMRAIAADRDIEDCAYLRKRLDDEEASSLELARRIYRAKLVLSGDPNA